MGGSRNGPVAVVDDDLAVLDSLRFLLEIAGHKTTVYDSGPDFLNDLDSRHCCAILDHHMPNMTGLEVVERLLAQGNDIPVLLITGMPSPAIVARAAALGVKQVLEKPPLEDDLLEFIARHKC